MAFSYLYSKVRGIVHKARKDYYIKLWDRDDWDQEGMLVLHELLSSQPHLVSDEARLYCYFKVKFRNHVKDVIRKQESQKRQFDRMSHEEIGSLSHMISTGGLLNDELVALRGMLREYRNQLPQAAHPRYDALVSGRSFKGRQAMIRDLQEYLSDFRESIP